MESRSFQEVVRELRAARGWSLEDLAFETRSGRDGKRLSVGYLGQLERGARPPTLGVMGAIASALAIDPYTITEYRLAALRRALDPQEVGLQAASDLLALIWPLVTPEEEERQEALAHLLGLEVEQMERLQQEEHDAADSATAPRATPRRAAG